MDAPNPSLAAATTLLRTLADLGLRLLVSSPGSRNTPLLYAAHDLGLDVWSVLDERSAGFAALGAARTVGGPVAVTCTSGTAAANYLPAVAEASNAGVPLIILTADRPDDLRDAGAPQTIDQVGLYASFVRWERSVGTPIADIGWMNRLAGTAARAWETALDRRGPVHLNLPFAEPLGRADDGPVPTAAIRPSSSAPTRATVHAEALGPLGPRPLVVAGDGAGGPALTELAAGVPVLADPLVVDRRPPLLLRGNIAVRTGAVDRLAPTGVLRLGGSPTSKTLVAWLGDRTEIPQVLADDVGRRDPVGSASRHLRVDPEAAAAVACDLAVEPGWLEAWTEAERAIDAALIDLPFPSEPAVARVVTEHAGDRDLWVGSSMPVRDVDDFAVPIDGRIHGTRGANGIDGLVSAATGAARAKGSPSLALVGDVAFLHDIGGLLTARRLGVDLTVVVVDNRGGGIFSFLPQADEDGPFDLLATPHDFDLAEIASGLGASVSEPADAAGLVAALEPSEGLSVVVVRTDREENRRLHADLLARVAASVDE